MTDASFETMQHEIEDYATELGTSVSGRIPYGDWIGVYPSTHGHHYRPAAQHLTRRLHVR